MERFKKKLLMQETIRGADGLSWTLGPSLYRDDTCMWREESGNNVKIVKFPY